jgi:hypothetical protein
VSPAAAAALSASLLLLGVAFLWRWAGRPVDRNDHRAIRRARHLRAVSSATQPPEKP